jgi:hypothetical protein
MNEDGVPADVLRRREMFAKLREELKRLKPDEVGMSFDMTEAEMLDALNSIERTLEYTEVSRNARVWCDQAEHEAATRPWPDDVANR